MAKITLQFKKLLTRMLVLLVKALGLLFFVGQYIARILKTILKPATKAGVKLLVLPTLGSFLKIRSKINKKTSGPLDRIILAMTNRYIIHAVIFLMIFGVTTSNILAYESQEDYGRDAVIYDIIGIEDLDSEEETVTSIDEPLIYNYLDGEAQLTSEVYSEAQKREEEIQEQQTESDLSITQGGNTLVKPDLASTEAAKVTRATIKNHIVGEGDTIGGIATEFNISVNTILWANSLSFSSYIKPGQTLIIPPTSGVLHTISKGDTLSKIASKYQTKEASIKNFNNIEDNDSLSIGDTIMVPGGRIVYTPKPRTYVSSPISAPAYTPPATAQSGQMIWPEACRRITQYYRGWRHTGIDIACGFGQPVYAVLNGKVSRVQYNKYGYGYHIIIDHGGGKQTLYAHNSNIYVKAGQKVKQGEVIAAEGSTGRSTGSHLHFEVRINGQRLNPLNYVK
jgi:murein DD-endopeptidase MepM/ murein hydrolase activator NlpD